MHTRCAPRGERWFGASLIKFLMIVISGRLDRQDSSDSELRVISQKNYDLCIQAANRITSIGMAFEEHLTVRRTPVFFSFYVFSASIMHVCTRELIFISPQLLMLCSFQF
jgi:hypothetical protein